MFDDRLLPRDIQDLFATELHSIQDLRYWSAFEQSLILCRLKDMMVMNRAIEKDNCRSCEAGNSGSYRRWVYFARNI